MQYLTQCPRSYCAGDAFIWKEQMLVSDRSRTSLTSSATFFVLFCFFGGGSSIINTDALQIHWFA